MSARGIGLIEVLVAMLVLSIGFLAVGQMQVSAMRENQNAYHESQARLLLGDMVDRMRDNPGGVRAGAYAPFSTETSTGSAAGCTTNDCNAAALAARDLAQWAESLDPSETALVPRLPNASGGTPAVGTIARDANGIHLLTLTWEGLVEGEIVELVASTRYAP